MATTRHWAIDSSTEVHNAVLGDEERDAQVSPLTDLSENNIKRAIEESEIRQLSAVTGASELHKAEMERLAGLHSDELCAFSDKYHESLDRLASHIFQKTEGVASGLGSLGKSLSDQLASNADRISQGIVGCFEEQWVLVDRRATAIETNIQRAVDIEAERQLEEANAFRKAFSAAFGSLQEQSSDELAAFSKRHHESVDELISHISRQNDGFAAGLNNLGRAIGDELEKSSTVLLQEQHALLGRSAAVIESNIKRAIDEADARQADSVRAIMDAECGGLSARLQVMHANLTSFGEQQRESTAELTSRISQQTEGFAVGLSSQGRAITEQLEKNAVRMAEGFSFLGETSRAALRVVQDDYAAAVIRLVAERDRATEALRASHAAELAGLRTSVAADFAAKDKAMADSALRIRHWAIVTVVGLALNAAAVVGAFLR